MIATYSHDQYTRPGHTVATLPDGRRLGIDLQYAVVTPIGGHADDCDLVRGVMGGRCTCLTHVLAGIDLDALVAEARTTDKVGPKPLDPAPEPAPDPAEYLTERGLPLMEDMDREDSNY
jgi:hypothetical protein